ncbi:ABC-2 type transport system permease protein [Marininema mesophilum]|uniref:Transport permease protein n=1 Tax=Marininema mesophilum TaxID=1048340 RepID=A0A1H2QVU4_9BACL|nr:ABC transporter permease [Marininema mesophilum]SDW11263.1 ABC-2 type transport system permease protein [Marininema mesophilum]
MWRRIQAIVGKEFIQLRRDRRTLAMMVMLPVLWLVAFGYAVNFDVETIRVVVVDEAKHSDSASFINQIKEEEDFKVTEKARMSEAKRTLEQGKRDVIIHFPKDYKQFPQNKRERIQIQVDGSRLFQAQSALRKLNGVLADVQQDSMQKMQRELQTTLMKSVSFGMGMDSPQWREMMKSLLPEKVAQLQKGLEKANKEQMESTMKRMEKALPKMDQIQPDVDVLYNPDLKSVSFMIPGLVGLVLIFITTLMTAMGVVREKERGTLEQLIVSPVSSFELLVGKLIPYCIIAVFDFLLVFAVGVWFFDVPFRGDLLPFLSVSCLFLLASLGIGLLISTVSQNQQQAMQLAILTLVPQFILSGFVFPLEAMPWGIRWLSYLMPLTYFIPISRGSFLKGVSPLTDEWGILALAIAAVLFLVLATIRFRRSLG